MDFSELWNNWKSSIWFYVAIIAIVALIGLIISRSSARRKLQKRINDGQIKINDMKSHPFLVEIAKTDAIARVNSELKDTANQCKKDFDSIQNNIKIIVNALQDANEFLLASKYNKCNEALSSVEGVITETQQLTHKLDEVLNGILSQSTLQRKRINELKSDFHDIKMIINDNPNNYIYCWEALDQITNDISHQFSDFESIMDASKYDEATALSVQIANSIEDLNTLTQRIPELTEFARNVLPNNLNKVQSKYQLLASQNAYLKHLNIDTIIANINEVMTNCLAKLKQCDLSDVGERLSECETKINQLSSNIDEEKNAHKDLQKIQESCHNELNKINDILQRVKTKDYGEFSRYDLKELNTKYQEISKKYANNVKAYNSLIDTYESHSVPATTLVLSFKEIEQAAKNGLDEIQAVVGSLSTSKTSELRVRELVDRFIVVLNEAKASISLSKLPSVSSKYNKDIVAAEDYLVVIDEQLHKKTVDIELLNKTIEDAQTIIVNLYRNVNALISTANDVEDFIMTCNKYRPYYNDVDSTLYSAELAYRNGEYTKACKMAAVALNGIDPVISQKLLANLDERLLQREV